MVAKNRHQTRIAKDADIITVKKARFQSILKHVRKLEEMLRVMESMNPRMRPIQSHTKMQWQETVESACTGIKLAVPDSLKRVEEP